MTVPEKTGISTYKYPNEDILVPPITAIRAVAPPGGCSVLVTCIATIDIATANGAVNQIISGKNLATVTPIIADTTCPPTKFLGCAKGLCMAPYTNTADAPKEPRRKTLSIAGKCKDCKKAIRPIPTKAPKKDQKCSLISTKVSL